MLIGIVVQTRPEWVDELTKSCKRLNLPCRLIDMKKHDWLEQTASIDVLVWRVHHRDIAALKDARSKIPLLEQRGIPCLPNSLMLWLYDNKIRQTYFFAANCIQTPKTFVSSDRAEAMSFAGVCSYPLVYKLSYGASSTGVSLITSKGSAERVIRRAINKPANRVIEAVKARMKWQSPLSSKEEYVYFQEYVRSDFDLRVVTFGNSIVSAFKRLNRPDDFRASGSGRWEKFDVDNLPNDPCDQAIEISSKHGFSVMSYDFLPHDSKWLVSEVSYTFLLNSIYVDTLFKKTDTGYEKLPPIPMGVNHLCAIIGIDPLTVCPGPCK